MPSIALHNNDVLVTSSGYTATILAFIVVSASLLLCVKKKKNEATSESSCVQIAAARAHLS
jgi:hypothetical protein